MAVAELPDADTLRQLLIFNPETGLFFWKKRSKSFFNSERASKLWNSKYAGKEAFTYANPSGHKVGSIFGKPRYAHRIAWVIHYGALPQEIDHINGDPADNRICNLRSVSHAENTRNQKLRSTNSSGHNGVHWLRRERLWRAEISVEGKGRVLGYFRSKDDAISARKEAENDLGYHPNHGSER